MDDFKPLFEYVEKNIENKMGLKELSDFMGYSPFYISRKFMDFYGIPEIELFANYKTKSMEEEKMTLSDDMHKMIFTILGNSFEEMAAGFCSKIELSLLPDNCLKIFDDGRGIKLDDDGVIHEEVLQNLFSGKPITKLEYAQMGDLPFDDLKLVNSLCEKLTITVWRNGKIYEQDYIRGVPQHSVTSKANDSKIPHGTQIVLKPDTSIFENTLFSREKLQGWISENYPDLMDKVKID